MFRVLGAGFSGLAAAISIGSKGEKAEVIDQRTYFGGKFQESVQAMRNYGADKGKFEEFRKSGIDLGQQNPIYRIIKFSPSFKNNVIYSDNHPLFYSFKRGNVEESIDTRLVKQAQTLGVKFTMGQREAMTKVDVVASGPVFYTGIGYEAHYKDIDIESDTIHFFLNNDWAPFGYTCIIPYGRREATVMVASFDTSSFNLIQQQFRKMQNENTFVSNLFDGGTKVSEYGTLGFYNVPQTAKIGGKLFVGESIGFVDASRGFGTRYAIESGILAARSLIDNIEYDTLWRNGFELELIEMFKRRLALQRLSNADYEKMIDNEKERISIEEYDALKKKQTQNFIKTFLIDRYTKSKLIEWRKRYDLSKLL